MKKREDKKNSNLHFNTINESSNTGNNFEIEYRFEFLKYFTAIGLATILYIISAKILLLFYNPDTSKAIEYAKNIMCIGGYNPEPIERTLYLLGVFIYSISFFGLIYIFNNYKDKLSQIKTKSIFWILFTLSLFIIATVTYKSFTASNPFSEAIQNSQDLMKTNWDFYFVTTFLHSNLYIYSLVLFPCLLLFFYKYNNTSSFSKISKYSVYIFCSLIIIAVFFISSFSFPYTFENKYDFNAVYYSVVQVYHGAPLLVDHFTNTYGLYPHFIMPFLKIFGLTIHSFTIIMATLLSFCFYFLLKTLDHLIQNKILVLFGFTAIFFNCYMYVRIVTPYDNAFSTSPIRWILLFSLLYYASIFVKHRSKILYYFSFIFFSYGMLWNPEIGIISYVGLIAFYCFLDLQNKNFKIVLINWLKHIVIAIVSLIVCFGLYELIIKIFYGKYPDILQMFSTIQVFSFIGLNMLPMPNTFHPYILIVFIYIIGLYLSISNVITKNITNKTALVFLVTCLGILFFPYYIGRSHNWNLFACSPMAFILLGSFADDLLKQCKQNKALFPLFGVALFYLSFSFFQTIYDYKRITDLIYEKDNKTINYAENEDIKRNAEYIKEKSSKDEKVLILSAVYKQSLYHSLSNTASIFNPGFCEIFYKKDYNRLLTLLENESSKIFFEPNYFRYSDLQIFPILASYYEFKESNGNFYYFEKRKELKKETAILRSNNNDVIHLITNNDLKQKVAYAQGKKGAIQLDKQFTVEVIVRPKYIPQSVFTQSATIFSNTIDSTGMILRQNDTIQNSYIFGFSNHGIICKVELNKWNYFVFIVDNATITGIINGNLLGTVPTVNPYINTKTPFYLGNECLNPGFYFGDIREIRISKGKTDNQDILSNWKKVQSLK